MSDKKQTAVEWYSMASFIELKFIYGDGVINKDLVKKGKEMEKDRMIKFANDYEEYCHKQSLSNRYAQIKSAEQYYNETYEH